MSQSQVFGLQQLYCPSDGEIDVDIVAVHGLNGDAIKTWTSKSNNVCWLSHHDLLPKYLKRARILTWGYNANISSVKGRPTSSDKILDHAQTLVAHLESDRELEEGQERPIIFLCHSLGGIIVKRALAYSASRSASRIENVHQIYTCTYAILFFGTPHHGSSKVRILGSLTKLASLSIPTRGLQLETQLVDALEQDSETLQNIADQFAPLMSRFRIFFFWEQEKMDLKYTKDYIVDQASAAPILDNTERCGIAADHSRMCKFGSSSEQGFRTVVAALRRYCRDAPDVIRVRVKKAAKSQRERRKDEAMELFQQELRLSPVSPATSSVVELIESSPRSDVILGVFRQQDREPVVS